MNENKLKNKKKIINVPALGIFIFIIFYSHTIFNDYFIPRFFPIKYKEHLVIKYLNINEISFLNTFTELISSLFILLLLIISLYKAVNTELETIPNEYPWILSDKLENNEENIESKIDEFAKKLRQNKNEITVNNKKFIEINERDEITKSVRYCKICKKIKPDRCHHCSRCNKCFLKYDHHCYLIDTCVTYSNYKYFMLTVLYGLLYSAAVYYFFGKSLFRVYIHEKKFKGYLFYYISLIVLSWLDLFILIFFIFHNYLISINMTNVEYLRETKERQKIEFYWDYDKTINKNNCYKKVKDIYNLGYANNFKEVFGDNPFLWIFPVRNKNPRDKDGVSFSRNNKFKDSEELISSI